MRILIVGINFWPEPTGVGKYTGEMAAYLSKAGHQVTVITAPPYYPYWKIQAGYHGWEYCSENWNNIHIIRCPLYVPHRLTSSKRLFHLFTFTLFSLPLILFQKAKKPDIVFTIEPTLFTAPIVAFRGKKNYKRNWLHIQDFELDAALNLGLLTRIHWFEKLAHSWELHVYQLFGTVSTISSSMLEKLNEIGVSQENIEFFPNWIDPSEIYPKVGKNLYRVSLEICEDDIVVLYSGSIGRKQGLESLITAMKIIGSGKHIQLVICGDGPGKQELVDSAINHKNVHFLPIQPTESLNELFNLADIHALPQRAGAADLVMPSKLLGMMASGKPIVASCPEGSRLYQVVNEIGIVVPPEDPEAFAHAIQNLAGDHVLRKNMGSKSRAFVVENNSSDRILTAIMNKMEKITGES